MIQALSKISSWMHPNTKEKHTKNGAGEGQEPDQGQRYSTPILPFQIEYVSSKKIEANLRSRNEMSMHDFTAVIPIQKEMVDVNGKQMLYLYNQSGLQMIVAPFNR